MNLMRSLIMMILLKDFHLIPNTNFNSWLTLIIFQATLSPIWDSLLFSSHRFYFLWFGAVGGAVHWIKKLNRRLNRVCQSQKCHKIPPLTEIPATLETWGTKIPLNPKPQMRYIPQSKYSFDEIVQQCYDAINRIPDVNVNDSECEELYQNQEFLSLIR